MSAEPKPDPARRRGRPGHDQETVIRRAIEVFNRRGYDGTSMGDLAKELGLTKSAIYHHVPSKSHLLAAALDEGIGALSRAIDEARHSGAGETAYERLRTAVVESVVILVQHQSAVTLLLRVRGNSRIELDALERRRKIDADLAGLVREAVKEGNLRADIDPDLTSRLVFGMVNSLTEWYKPDGAQTAREVAEALTSIAFDGLTIGEA